MKIYKMMNNKRKNNNQNINLVKRQKTKRKIIVKNKNYPQKDCKYFKINKRNT